MITGRTLLARADIVRNQADSLIVANLEVGQKRASVPEADFWPLIADGFEVVSKAHSSIGPVSHAYDSLGRYCFVR